MNKIHMAQRVAESTGAQHSILARVVKAPFFKANLKAVSKRLIKASEMLVAPRISECFGLGLL